jgi:hypothetical protein
MGPVGDLAIALVAIGLAACSANVTETEAAGALRDGGVSDANAQTIDLEASCTPTEGGANALDACASLPPLCPDPTCPTYQCSSDGIAAACVVGQTYACVAPPPLFPDNPQADPGQADAQTVPPAACAVGKTFCYRNQQNFVTGKVSCPDVPDACANNPSCACLCGSPQYHCYEDCVCVESGGFATITCQQN